MRNPRTSPQAAAAPSQCQDAARSASRPGRVKSTGATTDGLGERPEVRTSWARRWSPRRSESHWKRSIMTGGASTAGGWRSHGSHSQKSSRAGTELDREHLQAAPTSPLRRARCGARCQAWGVTSWSRDRLGAVPSRTSTEDGSDGEAWRSRSGVGDAERDEEAVAVAQRAARVDDVRHVAVLLVGLRVRAAAADVWPMTTRRVVEVEQQRADRVRAHRADAVGEHEPALVGLDRRPAVADLDRLPRLVGDVERRRRRPAPDVVGEGDARSLAVVAGQRGEPAADPAREQRQALVGGARRRAAATT